MMEPRPVKTPLPCYGLELNMHDPICQRCPHSQGCHKAMGRRATQIPLSQASYDLVPAAYKLNPLGPDEDPEIVYIQQLYGLCHQTIFGKIDKTSIKTYTSAIIQNARALHVSIRLYFLAAMIGHAKFQATLIEHTDDRADPAPFNPKILVSKRGYEHVKLYAEICRSKFGTFTLGAMEMVNKNDFADDDVEKAILQSEVIAGQYIVQHKMTKDGPAEPSLYHAYELTLDPHWLATEMSYREFVLKSYMITHEGTKAQKGHRFAVNQVIRYMVQNPRAGVIIHLARSNAMPQAVQRVVSKFGIGADDLEIENAVVTDAFLFWKELGRAMQQRFCLDHYYGNNLIS